MNPGGQTVTFVLNTENPTPGRVGPVMESTSVDVSGCVLQPLGVSEVITDTDIETELWRCIAPPVSAALSIDTNGVLIFNRDTYQVTGPKPFYDFSGAVDHVTIDCKKQQG